MYTVNTTTRQREQEDRRKAIVTQHGYAKMTRVASDVLTTDVATSSTKLRENLLVYSPTCP